MTTPVGHRFRSHYDWLQENFAQFLTNLGMEHGEWYLGLIGAHGDKCYCNFEWKKAGIPFEHGVAIFLLTYVNPWRKETREVGDKWVAPDKWVIDNYPRFKDKLPPPDPIVSKE